MTSTAVIPAWKKLTPARKVALIQELYQPESTSATDLANRIFCTYGQRVPRNAIIGLYARKPELRMNFPLTGINQNSIPSSAKSEHLKQIAEARREKAAQDAKDRAEKALAPTPEPHVVSLIANRRAAMKEWADANSKNLTLLELTTGVCRWPVNDGGPFLFCGCNIEHQHRKQSMYCTYHARINTTRVTED